MLHTVEKQHGLTDVQLVHLLSVKQQSLTVEYCYQWTDSETIIAQCDVEHIMMLPIKAMCVLMFSTFIITMSNL
jgi:hypothetical protein